MFLWNPHTWLILKLHDSKIKTAALQTLPDFPRHGFYTIVQLFRNQIPYLSLMLGKTHVSNSLTILLPSCSSDHFSVGARAGGVGGWGGANNQMVIRPWVASFLKSSRFFVSVFVDDLDWWQIKKARPEAFLIARTSLRWFVYFQDIKA